ncbi:MAG: hypothetical protein JNL38_14790 [Myxococcales bacterium]|jgi:hypothetical protein|nr:hypothetical protein [Myxococcales bacterium]
MSEREPGHFQMPLPSEGEPETDAWLRPLPAAEFEALVARGLASLDGPEGDELADLHAWFVRRYPTPTARLAYVRAKSRARARRSG